MEVIKNVSALEDTPAIPGGEDTSTLEGAACNDVPSLRRAVGMGVEIGTSEDTNWPPSVATEDSDTDGSGVAG